jgi:EmrB/QacA subfamily drug resistance transporter
MAFARTPRAEDPDRLDPALIKLGLAVVLGVIMSLLDTTIVNVAIDTLHMDLHAPISTVQWVTTGYLLALAVAIPLTGWATDRFGPKRLFLASIVVFTLCSMACGLAWNIDSLIFFRVLQGLGGAFILPVAQTVMARAAGPHRMGRMMALIGIPAMLAPVFGPVLGGLLVDDLSWRWIFFVNLPIGIAALIACTRVLPADRPEPSQQLDLRGFLLLGPGLAAFVYGLSEAATTHSFTSTTVLAWCGAGLVLIGLFVANSLARKDMALIPVRYFRDRSFTAASIVTAVVGGALYGAMILLPLYYQQIRGESALTAGLLLAPQGIGAAISMSISGSIADRIGYRKVVVTGLLIMLGGTVYFTQLGPFTAYWVLSVSMFVRGIGLGASMMPAMAGGYQNLAQAEIGRATTALSIFQRVGGSIGTALCTVVLATRAADNLASSKTPAEALSAGAHAFGQSFWVVMALTVLGLAAAAVMPSFAHQRAAAAARVERGGGVVPAPAEA